MSQGQNTNKKSSKGIIQIVHAEAKVEYPRTITEIKSKAKSIKDWMFNICDGKKPDKSIAEFILEFSESSKDGYRLRFYGVNIYKNTTNGNDVKIDYEPNPSDMYFIPEKSEYEKLTYKQFKEKITIHIKETLNSEKIKSSFLSEANYIYLSFRDEKIMLK